MQSNRERVLALRRKDWTLPQIVTETGLAKSTVYYYIRSTPLSPKKRVEISAASKQRALRLAARRRGVSAREFNEVGAWDENSIFLLSHLIFDGTLRRSDLSYQSRSKSLLQRVERAMSTYYQYAPKRYVDLKTGVERVSYFNVALGSHIIRKTKELLRDIPHLPPRLQLEFLRSFFDDEGCIDFRPQRGLRRIRGYQKDVQILKVIQLLLHNIGIESRLVLPNEVMIVGKKNLLAFQEHIGFSEGVRINGKRSNSIWKKSYEKRILLKRAIASYQS